jgi:hypothetical protein
LFVSFVLFQRYTLSNTVILVICYSPVFSCWVCLAFDPIVDWLLVVLAKPQTPFTCLSHSIPTLDQQSNRSIMILKRWQLVPFVPIWIFYSNCEPDCHSGPADSLLHWQVSLLIDTKRMATCRAMDYCELYALTRADLEEAWFHRSPAPLLISTPEAVMYTTAPWWLHLYPTASWWLHQSLHWLINICWTMDIIYLISVSWSNPWIALPIAF